MLFETLGQARVFLLMAAAGACIALVYGGLQAARAALFDKGPAWSALPEMGFACAAGALLFLALRRVEAPALRPYALLGAAVGFFLCASTVLYALRRLGEKWRAARAARRGKNAENRGGFSRPQTVDRARARGYNGR